MKQQFLKSKTGTIRLTIYQDNRPIVPTSAKVTLCKAGSTSELQAQADASVDETTGEMTYSLTATHTASHDTNYKAVWEYVYNGSTYYETQLFDVVKSILSIPITDNDLYQELPSLRKKWEQRQGTAGSATSTTLVDTTKLKEADDYWTGGVIKIISGTGIGQQRDVTDFVQSTGTITVSPAWVTTPDTTSIYIVVRSFKETIEQGFDEIENMLYNKGKRDALILEGSQIKYPLLYRVLHKICQDCSDEENDKWDRLAKSYDEKFKTSFSTLTLDYDEDESGAIEGTDEEQRGQAGLEISRC